MRSLHRYIFVLIFIGLLVVPTAPALAADTTGPALIERVINWIDSNLGLVSIFDSQEANESAPPDPPPTTTITPEGAPETSSTETDGEMYPEWDPNG